MYNIKHIRKMKSLINYSKLVLASLIASSTFVACSEEITENSVETPYVANTANLKSAGSAVDLGLSSGTLWADKNVGAASAKDNGVLFIWGDVTGTQSLATTTTYETAAVATSELFDRFRGSAKVASFKESQELYNDNYIALSNDKVELVYEGAMNILKSVASSYTGEGDLQATIQAVATNGDPLYILTDAEGKVLDSNNYRDYKERVYQRDEVKIMDGDKVKYVGHYAEALDASKAAMKTLTEKEELLNKVKTETPDDKAAIERKQKAVDKAQAALKKAEENLQYWDTYVTEQELFFNDYSVVISAINTTEEVNYFEAMDYADKDGDFELSKRTYNGDVYDKVYKGHDYNDIFTNDFIGNAKFDAAAANWGGDWQMPTKKQLEELIKECEWKFEGNGYTVTGPNGNSIFLPADGYRYGDNCIGKGTAGYYATGSIIGSYHFPSLAEQMDGGKGTITSAEKMPNLLIFQHGDFDESIKMYNNLTTIYGVSIRPVIPAK